MKGLRKKSKKTTKEDKDGRKKDIFNLRKEVKYMKKLNIIKYFKEMEDYRQQWKIDHQLIEIIVMTVAAVLCGAENYPQIHEFAKMKEKYFRKFLKLENGIPSQDTFERLFRYTNPKEFEKSFLNLINDMAGIKKGIRPIDGKALRGANDYGENPLYIVSAWAKESGIVLASKKVEEKSNEITAIPEVLKLIDIEGSIVTLDAMGCQEEIVKQIVESKGEYVIGLKGNQGETKEEVEDFYHACLELGFGEIKYDYYETIEKSHGRIEQRRYYITEDLNYITTKAKWKGLKSVGMVHRIIERNGKTSEEKRYHISSIEADAKKYGEAVRGHWSIENNFNWIMDVAFNEDKSRIRKDNGAENMAIIRRFVMNLLKKETKIKGSYKTKLKALSWDTDYALSLIFDPSS